MEVSRLEARVVILTKDKLCLESKLGHVEKDILVLQKKNKWLLEQVVIHLVYFFIKYGSLCTTL